MKKFSLLFAAAVIAAACGQVNDGTTIEITADDVRTHISWLASDSLQGRKAGTEFEAQAASYIAERLQRYGLQPAGESGTFFQEFPITLGVRLGDSNQLISGESSWSAADSSVFPWANSKSGQASGKLVFAGYGITAPELKYDDYTGIDVNGSVVMILRYGPDGASNPHSEFGAFWPVRDKIRRAVDHGAKAVILAAAPGELLDDVLLPLDRERMMAESDIPVLQMHPDKAKELLALAGIDLDAAVKTMANKKTASKSTDLEISVEVSLEADRQNSRNVVGLLEGLEPEKGTIVIGAHFDHLGYGDSGSLFRGPEPRIHNGADDNASGTAGVLELAQYFSRNRIKHNILFMGFGAEEMGLLGSDHFVNHPTYPLERMKAMINMDMIGRMSGGKLLIFGIGSSADWEEVVLTANTDSLDLKLVPDGTGASDHTSFYNKGIPVLHYFTDTHSDYHRPSDDTEFINFDGEVAVLKHIARTVEAIDKLPSNALAYTTAPVTQNRNMRIGNVTLGVLPDYSYEGPGMKITGTTEGSAGAKAGLQANDIILGIGQVRIKDIYDYMESLNTFKPGDQSTITVKRGEEEISLPVQF